jgi:hypothetical protein
VDLVMCEPLILYSRSTGHPAARIMCSVSIGHVADGGPPTTVTQRESPFKDVHLCRVEAPITDHYMTDHHKKRFGNNSGEV